MYTILISKISSVRLYPLCETPDLMRQSQKDIVSGVHLSPEQLKARQLRIEVANNWIAKLRQFEQKNYPAPVAKIMAKTASAAIKWTKPFTREDAGAMQITLGNIAGEKGEKIVKKYNEAEEKIAAKSDIVAKVVDAKNSFVAREGQGMVHDGRKIKDELKAIPGEIKEGVQKVIPESPPTPDPTLVAKKEEAKQEADTTQKKVIDKAQELGEASQEATQAQTDAEKKGKEAQEAQKDVSNKFDAIVQGKPSNKHENNTDNTASPELKKKLSEIKKLTPREQVTALRDERNGYIHNQLMHPDEKQQKMMMNFIESKKSILPTLILDEDFNKKLNEGKLTPEDILKQPALLDLFLKERGDEFYDSLTESEKNDVKVIDEILAIAIESLRRLEEAEEATRKFADAERERQKKEQEYFDAATSAKNAQAQLYQAENELKASLHNVSDRNSIVSEKNTLENTDSIGSTSAYMEYRRERFQDTMRAEIGGEMSTRLEREDSGEYIIVSKNTGQEIDSDGWSRFSRKRDARKAQLRYELFSEKPLDVFLSQNPDYIDKIKDNPIIENIWNNVNPGEKMRIMDFRRLIMVGLMKVMNPMKYGNMSFHTILSQSEGSVIDEFRTTYEQNGKILGLENAGMSDIRKIMNIIVDSNTWNPNTNTSDNQNTKDRTEVV